MQDIVIGAPRVKEVHCLMPKKYAQQLSNTEKYRILHVSRAPSILSYENILAITSLQPDYTGWLTAASGIPLHPQYVASRDEMKSSTVSSFENFHILLNEAKHIRSLCKNKEGAWLEAEQAKDAIAKYILYYCNNNASDANYIAQVLQFTLHVKLHNCGRCCLLLHVS